jgi:hypothetical protein
MYGKDRWRGGARTGLGKSRKLAIWTSCHKESSLKTGSGHSTVIGALEVFPACRAWRRRQARQSVRFLGVLFGE